MLEQMKLTQFKLHRSLNTSKNSLQRKRIRDFLQEVDKRNFYQIAEKYGFNSIKVDK